MEKQRRKEVKKPWSSAKNLLVGTLVWSCPTSNPHFCPNWLLNSVSNSFPCCRCACLDLSAAVAGVPGVSTACMPAWPDPGERDGDQRGHRVHNGYWRHCGV